MADFQQVMADYGATLQRVAAGYASSRADRQDLAQDIAFALIRALPRYRGESSLRTYVLRIAHNCAIRHMVRRGAAAAPLSEDKHAHAAPGPEHTLAVKQDTERLFALVRELPLGTRQVLMLTLEELSQREIAEVLGLSENVVGVRLHRARKHLRERMRTPPQVEKVKS